MQKLKILVTAPVCYATNTFLTDAVREKLESIGEVIYNPYERQLSAGEIFDMLVDVDVCIAGWGTVPFDEKALKKANRLKVLAYLGGSVAMLVSNALFEKDIKVFSGNRVFAESVGEGVICYLLAAMRRVPYYTELMKKNGWIKPDEFMNCGLLDRMVGILGFGMVAKYLTKQLVPFNAKVKVYAPHLTKQECEEYNIESVTIEEIFSTCDVVSVHLAKTPETYHIVDAKLLGMLKKGAFFANCARGDIVNETELIRELKKENFYAILDVYEQEPLPMNSELRTLNNVLLMPHMVGPSIDRRPVVAKRILEDIEKYMLNGQADDLYSEIPKEYVQYMTRETYQPPKGE